MKTQAEILKKILPVLVEIRKYIADNGSAPTYRKIAEMAGSKAVATGNDIVQHLESQGFITRMARKGRSLKLTTKALNYKTGLNNETKF